MVVGYLDKRRPLEQGGWGGFLEEGGSVPRGREHQVDYLEQSQVVVCLGATQLEVVWGEEGFLDRLQLQEEGGCLGRGAGEEGSWGAQDKLEEACFRHLSVRLLCYHQHKTTHNHMFVSNKKQATTKLCKIIDLLFAFYSISWN